MPDADYLHMSDAMAENARNQIVKAKGFFIKPSQLFKNVADGAKSNDELNTTLANNFKEIEESAVGTASEDDVRGLFSNFNTNDAGLGSTVEERNELLTTLLESVRDLLPKIDFAIVGEPTGMQPAIAEKGLMVVERTPDSDEDEMMMMALDAGAEDVKALDDAFEIYTAPNDFSTVREALEKQGLSFLSAEVQMIPQNTVSVADPDTLVKIQKLLDMLEENDDVQNVFHNAELPEEEEED